MKYLTNLVIDLEEEKVVEAVKQELNKNTPPMAIIEACQKGMIGIGEKFQSGDCFLPELLVAADIFNSVMAILEDKISGEHFETKATIVLGTVKGDIHDIGKNIFKTIAVANGFNVCDLGVDVPVELFAETVKKENAQIVGMSGLLTTAFESMKETVGQLKEAGLRDKVKVIIGGAPVDERVMDLVGSDAFTKNASEGVDICRAWVKA